MQVVDLMLQDARVPSRCFQCLFYTAFVQKFHGYGARPGNKCRKTCDTQTSLEEFNHLIALLRNSRVDDGVKRHGPPFAFSKLLLGDVLMIFRAVLNHRELYGKADLRSCKA